MKRHLVDGTIIDVIPYTSDMETIKVYDINGNVLETVRRIIYRDMRNSDLYINYGKCFRYVSKMSSSMYRCIVDIDTLPIGKTIERAY